MELFLETSATIFGILSVWYARNNNVYVFPTGILSVLIFAYITYENRIYAEVCFQLLIFLFLSYKTPFFPQYVSSKF